jgi:hypothetical protein
MELPSWSRHSRREEFFLKHFLHPPAMMQNIPPCKLPLSLSLHQELYAQHCCLPPLKPPAQRQRSVRAASPDSEGDPFEASYRAAAALLKEEFASVDTFPTLMSPLNVWGLTQGTGSRRWAVGAFK